MNTRPFCECGCGSPVNWDRKRKCWCRFISEHTNRVNHPFFGKHHTQKSKELKRLANLGKHSSPETEFKEGEIHNPLGIGGWKNKKE